MCDVHGRFSLLGTHLILTLSPWASFDDSLFAGQEKEKKQVSLVPEQIKRDQDTEIP